MILLLADLSLEQQISHFGRKITSLKEAFREARDEEEGEVEVI
jgi:hypothetical protein